MVARVHRAASSASKLVAMVEGLLADSGSAEDEIDGGEPVPDGAIDRTELRHQQRTLRQARKGEPGKALKSCKLGVGSLSLGVAAA